MITPTPAPNEKPPEEVKKQDPPLTLPTDLAELVFHARDTLFDELKDIYNDILIKGR